MPFSNTSIEIRPRTQWESIDLGILLTRQHFQLIIGTWLLVTLPVFLLLSFIFWQKPLIPIFIIWWLKPIFDRIPLHILSHVTFNNVPTAKQTLFAWVKGLKHYLLTDLIFSRISLTRSFNLPVQQLENAKGKTRRLRLRVLSHSQNKAGWLTIIFINFELILSVSLTILLYKLLPESIFVSSEESFLDIFTFGASELWAHHLNGLLYVLVLAVTETLYVACGFCLYLNRRITLEGWDIELAFRRLSKRLGQLVTIIAMALLLPCMVGANFAMAQTNINPEEELLDITPLTEKSSASQPSDILEKRQQAQQSIKKIVTSPPFYEVQEQTVYRWKSSPSPQSSNNNFFTNAIGWFFSNLFPLLLWSLLGVGVVMIVWYAVNQLPNIKGVGRRKEKTQAPEQIFGLAIKPETLPDDILATFEQQWQEQPRQALSLLYRALLSHLVHQHRLPLKSSHTEHEVVSLTHSLKLESLSQFTQQLTQQWLLVAYGHYPPDVTQKDKLKQGWQQIQSIQEPAK